MNITDILTPELTTAIVQAVVALLASLLTALVAMAVKFIRVKTTAAQFEFIQNTAAIAVSAAEQMGMTGAVEDKKTFALNHIEDELAKRGIKVTARQLDTAIEAAVHDGINAGRAVDPVESVDADIVQGDITGLTPQTDFNRLG